MENIIQNNPLTFQTDSLHTLYDITGTFTIEKSSLNVSHQSINVDGHCIV